MVVMMLASIGFMAQGLMMELQVFGKEQAFNDLQAEYWNVDKAMRDSAPAGSQLQQELVRIQQYPSQLMKLKLVGISFILSGIFVLLPGIRVALIAMPPWFGVVPARSQKR